MKYHISPKNYLSINSKIILILTTFHFLTRLFINIFDLQTLTIANIFLLDVERNLPTLYSGISLILSSLLLYFCSSNEFNIWKKINFIFISLFFLFLAADEMFMIHEIFGPIFRKILNPNLFLYFAWVVPYGILTLLVSIYFYSFIKTFPKNIFRLIILSGILFVGGELFLEMIGAYIYTQNNKELSFSYLLISSLEEIFAMFGIVLFNFSIIKLLSSSKFNIKIRN